VAEHNVRVGGVWLSSIAAWSGLTYSFRYPGGGWEASWDLAGISVDFHHQALERGNAVEVFLGADRIWKGVLNEPDRASWSCTAKGLGQLANAYIAFDGGGNTSSVPDTAVDAAITRGLPWTRPASLSNTAEATASGTDGVNYLDTLLDTWSQHNDNRWIVDQDGQLLSVADPTLPMWQMTPVSGVLGVADDQYASTVYARFRDSGAAGAYTTTSSTDADAETRWGRVELAVDITPLGPITSTRAGQFASKMVAKDTARPGWTNDLEPGPYELVNLGGVQAEFGLVQAGQMVRLNGVLDPRIIETRVDVVIAESTHYVDDRRLVLRPMGRAERTLADVSGINPNTKLTG
jgi:hypothetical protein